MLWCPHPIGEKGFSGDRPIPTRWSSGVQEYALPFPQKGWLGVRVADLPMSSQPRMQASGSHETGYQPRSTITAGGMSDVSLGLGELRKTAGHLSVRRPAVEHIADPGPLHLPSVERLPPHRDEELG